MYISNLDKHNLIFLIKLYLGRKRYHREKYFLFTVNQIQANFTKLSNQILRWRNKEHQGLWYDLYLMLWTLLCVLVRHRNKISHCSCYVFMIVHWYIKEKLYFIYLFHCYTCNKYLLGIALYWTVGETCNLPMPNSYNSDTNLSRLALYDLLYILIFPNVYMMIQHLQYKYN